MLSRTGRNSANNNSFVNYLIGIISTLHFFTLYLLDWLVISSHPKFYIYKQSTDTRSIENLESNTGIGISIKNQYFGQYLGCPAPDVGCPPRVALHARAASLPPTSSLPDDYVNCGTVEPAAEPPITFDQGMVCCLD